MDIVVALVLVVVVLAVLALPFYRSHPRLHVVTSHGLDDLMAQRDGLYATVRDLDLDYQVGKLDTTDYRTRRDKYLARAAAVLRQIDALRSREPTVSVESNEIEKEVAALRTRSSEKSRAQIAEATTVERSVTSEPGRDHHRLTPVVDLDGDSSKLVCPGCGQSCQADDRFCRRCGRALN